MIDLHASAPQYSPSRLHEILLRHGCNSVVDPIMGLPMHLHYLKHHGIAVHGADMVEWFVRVGEGLIANDLIILRDVEVAEIVEMLPGRIYPLEMFKAWEGVFFTEEQCIYLGVWHDNVRHLRSDGQTGLAILGLWRTFCFWLQKMQSPDDMQDVAPSELAWSYIRQTENLVMPNMRRNTVRLAPAIPTIEAVSADALFLSLPTRVGYRFVDPRVWMWEAWWRGDPYFTLERALDDALFGPRSAEAPAYAQAVSNLLAHANAFPVVVVHTSQQHLAEIEPLVRESRAFVEVIAPRESEIYLVATK